MHERIYDMGSSELVIPMQTSLTHFNYYNYTLTYPSRELAIM